MDDEKVSEAEALLDACGQSVNKLAREMMLR